MINIQLRIFGLDLLSVFASTDDEQVVQYAATSGNFELAPEPEASDEYYEEGFGFR